MKLLDVMTSPWAILPDKLHEIRSIYETHMRSEKLDLKGLKREAKTIRGPDTENPDDLRGYAIDRGVAIIPVMDVLSKNRTFFSYLFGGTSMRDIGDALRNALQDSDVHSIVLHIDSPGGTVDGTEELTSLIFSARGNKPVVAYADGLMASAAYWIGSAADRIYIAGETTEVGSVGVVATHVDVSKQDEMWGEKWTEITAGKYKRIASMHAPLSDDGKAYIQGQVDEIYRIFVDSVAANRGLSVEQVLEAADGKVFMGRAAVDNGLVDDLKSLEDIITQLMEENLMNIEDLKSKHPDLYRAAYDEGRTAGAQEAQEAIKTEAFAAGKTEGLKEGADKERERITAMDDILIPGHEALLAECKKDHACSAADFSMKQAKAEQAIRATELDKIKGDAISTAAHAGAPAPGTEAGSTDHLPLEDRAKAEWNKSPDLRAEFKDNYNAYLAYEKNAAAGRIKIFGRK